MSKKLESLILDALDDYKTLTGEYKRPKTYNRNGFMTRNGNINKTQNQHPAHL